MEVLALIICLLPFALVPASVGWRLWLPRGGKIQFMGPQMKAQRDRACKRHTAMQIRNSRRKIALSLVVVSTVNAYILAVSVAVANDFGQWTGQDVAVQQWFRNLTMPDFPAVSCCANADGYWADSFEVKGNHYVAIITDPRPDGPLHREHIAFGTAIVIPDYKIKWDRGNPTGHGWVFVGAGSVVHCYLPPGAV